MDLIATGFPDYKPETWTAIGTLALAAATFALAVVTVFSEPLRRRFVRAKVNVELSAEPPDTHQIELTNVLTGQGVGRAVYVRARVSHDGGVVADNVEVLARGVWRLTAGERESLAAFLPLNLVWSHFQPPRVTMRIPRDSFRHCDVGSLQQDVTGETVFVVSTMVQPNRVSTGAYPNILPAGTYEVELQVSGDNVKTRRSNWKISFPSQWSNDEATMLRALEIEPVTTRRRWLRRGRG